MKPLVTSGRMRFLIRVVYGCVIVGCVLVSSGIVFLSYSKQVVYTEQAVRFESPGNATEDTDIETKYFPVGVDLVRKTIIEQPAVEGFLYNELAYKDPASPESWWQAVTATLVTYEWYQQLASPVSRIIVIWPGERIEQVMKASGDVLRWDDTSKTEFKEIAQTLGHMPEGTLLPGRYITHRYASPSEVAHMINERFKTEIVERYPPELAETLSLEDTLIIASLLEREARDFTDMREISGVIWNRLFIDMPLQLDATLQYAKANQTNGATWWPVVRPADKFIESPFNTYQNKGLPPSPIANPSPEAILAALNPKATSCYFYFHDDNRQFYCSETYEEHVRKLQTVFGQGS